MSGARPATVADAMLRHPTIHPATLTVGDARAAFASSPKTHLLLVIADGRLITTLTRPDLDRADDPAATAAPLGALAGRTVRPDVALDSTWDAMIREGRRRLAVVDDAGRLLGLLCLKSSLRGFCTDDAVAAMRRERVVLLE